MKTSLITMTVAIGVFGMTICMALGVTVQKWTNFLTPLSSLNRAILLGSVGLIITYFCVRAGMYTLRILSQEENFQLLNGFRLIAIFSLTGFGFGLSASALTLFIGLIMLQ